MKLKYIRDFYQNVQGEKNWRWRLKSRCGKGEYRFVVQEERPAFVVMKHHKNTERMMLALASKESISVVCLQKPRTHTWWRWWRTALFPLDKSPELQSVFTERSMCVSKCGPTKRSLSTAFVGQEHTIAVLGPADNMTSQQTSQLTQETHSYPAQIWRIQRTSPSSHELRWANSCFQPWT